MWLIHKRVTYKTDTLPPVWAGTTHFAVFHLILSNTSQIHRSAIQICVCLLCSILTLASGTRAEEGGACLGRKKESGRAAEIFSCGCWVRTGDLLSQVSESTKDLPRPSGNHGTPGLRWRCTKAPRFFPNYVHRGSWVAEVPRANTKVDWIWLVKANYSVPALGRRLWPMWPYEHTEASTSL